MLPASAGEGWEELLLRGGEGQSFLRMESFVFFFESLAVEVGDFVATPFVDEVDPAVFSSPKLLTLLTLPLSFC